MSYTDEDVKRLLGYLFNGGRWRRPETPDEGMPSAKANPAHLGTDMAEAIDMRRAWFATLERGDLLDPMALFKTYGQGLPGSWDDNAVDAFWLREMGIHYLRHRGFHEEDFGKANTAKWGKLKGLLAS